MKPSTRIKTIRQKNNEGIVCGGEYARIMNSIISRTEAIIDFLDEQHSLTEPTETKPTIYRLKVPLTHGRRIEIDDFGTITTEIEKIGFKRCMKIDIQPKAAEPTEKKPPQKTEEIVGIGTDSHKECWKEETERKCLCGGKGSSMAVKEPATHSMEKCASIEQVENGCCEKCYDLSISDDSRTCFIPDCECHPQTCSGCHQLIPKEYASCPNPIHHLK